MRKLVIALSIATMTFAITNIYLARELRSARADIATSAATAPARMTPVQRADFVPGPLADAPGPAPVAPNNNPSGSSGPAGRAGREIALDANQNMRENLQKLRDPALRRQLHDQMKEMFRDPSLAEYLGLSRSTYEQLLELRTEQYLSTMEASIRCQLERDCRSLGLDQSTLEAQKFEVAQLIGAENQQRLETYEMSRNERGDIERLRGRLSDKNRLTDDQAEKFIAAIIDERKRIEAEITQRGGNFGVSSINGQTYYLTFDNNGGTRVDEAAEYNRRIHERAAQVLTEQQLAVYDQMREETLNVMRATTDRTGGATKPGS